MRVDAIQKLLTILGCRQIRETSDKVLSTCPFEHEHSSGHDKNPSFVVFASSDESRWNCSYPHSTRSYSSGSMESLVRSYCHLKGIRHRNAPWGARDEGVSLNTLYSYVWKNDLVKKEKNIYELDRFDKATYDKGRKRLFVSASPFHAPADSIKHEFEASVFPESYLDAYTLPTGRGLQYLKGRTRRLTDDAIEAWEILYQEKNLRIVLPIRNDKGELVAISRRTILPDRKPKYLHSKGFRRNLYLYGEHPRLRQPFKKIDRGIVVEGQFDAIRLWQLGYRGVVAILGAEISAEQVVKFNKIFKEAVILTDGDDAGRVGGAKSRQKFLDSGIPARLVELPDGVDPGDPNFSENRAIEILGSPDVDSEKFPWEK